MPYGSLVSGLVEPDGSSIRDGRLLWPSRGQHQYYHTRLLGQNGYSYLQRNEVQSVGRGGVGGVYAGNFSLRTSGKPFCCK
jgi:hypothetical protein